MRKYRTTKSEIFSGHGNDAELAGGNRYMKRLFFINYITLVFLLLMPIGVHAQSEQGVGGNPPIAQPLIREGDLAISLVSALKLGTATSEVEAENMLAKAAVLPRNGWIADYPVTPDI